jgi:hypothetical protein
MRFRTSLVLAAAVLTSSVVALTVRSAFRRVELPPISRALAALSECPTDEGGPQVFPNGVFASEAGADDQARGSASAFLRAMGEGQPLWCGQQDARETYRLIALDAIPVVVTIAAVDGDRRLMVAESRRPANSGPAAVSVVDRRERWVSNDEWEALQRGFESEAFWRMNPYGDERCTGCDAWPWILEARLNTAYHVVSHTKGPVRLLPDSEYARFLVLARHILTIAGLETTRDRPSNSTGPRYGAW